MNRREVITLLGGAVTSISPPSLAQRRAQKIGVLATADTRALPLIRERFAELERTAESRSIQLLIFTGPGRLETMAEELVRERVDVIITVGIQATQTAAKVTKTIPIVQSPGGDLVAARLAASNARPGGNVTGFVLFDAELNAKRLELLRATFPERRRVAVVGLRDMPPGVLARLRGDAAAFDIVLLEEIVDLPAQLGEAIVAAGKHAEALLVPANAILFQHRVAIVGAASAAGLPGVYPEREYVTAGGLLAYAPDIDVLYRRLGDTVVKILNGADPATLPIEGPTTFALIVNQRTARLLGIALPASLLARADEVIE